MAVVTESNKILSRISKGYTGELPDDPAVLNYVRNCLIEVFDRIEKEQIKDFPETLKNKRIENKRCSNVGTKRTLNVSFGDTFVINTSAYADDLRLPAKSTSDRPQTPCVSLKKMTKTVIYSHEKDTEIIPIPDALNARALQHLYHFQKTMILENIQRFEQNVNKKIEQIMRLCYDLKRFKFDCPIKRELLNSRNEVIEAAVRSILTLPEKDTYYVETVLKMVETLKARILHHLEGLM